MKRMATLLLLIVAAGGLYGVARADTPPPYLATWGFFGTGPGQFNQPYGIDVDVLGNVYVSDEENQRIQKFAPDGTFLLQWPTGTLSEPVGLRIGPGGVVYCVMNHTHVVKMFSTSGASLGQFGFPSEFLVPGGLYYPNAIAFDAAGYAYVVDSGHNVIQKFTSTGTFVSLWGGSGSAPGQFDTPYGIAVDATDHVYVSDRNNNRIEVFTTAGVFSMQFGSAGSGDGQFAGLAGMDFDTNNDLYVIDAGSNSRVQKFTSSGVFLTKWGSLGSGQDNFSHPADVAADPYGRVYVTDYGNNRIQVFGNQPVLAKKTTWGSIKAAYR